MQSCAQSFVDNFYSFIFLSSSTSRFTHLRRMNAVSERRCRLIVIVIRATDSIRFDSSFQWQCATNESAVRERGEQEVAVFTIRCAWITFARFSKVYFQLVRWRKTCLAPNRIEFQRHKWINTTRERMEWKEITLPPAVFAFYLLKRFFFSLSVVRSGCLWVFRSRFFPVPNIDSIRAKQRGGTAKATQSKRDPDSQTHWQCSPPLDCQYTTLFSVLWLCSEMHSPCHCCLSTWWFVGWGSSVHNTTSFTRDK